MIFGKSEVIKYMVSLTAWIIIRLEKIRVSQHDPFMGLQSVPLCSQQPVSSPCLESAECSSRRICLNRLNTVISCLCHNIACDIYSSVLFIKIFLLFLWATYDIFLFAYPKIFPD